MANVRTVYRCRLCGQVVEVLTPGAGELVCCGEPMKELTGQTTDGAAEKHLPVAEAVEDGVRIRVGSEPHPMRPEHWIDWIEAVTADSVWRRELAPGDEPAAFFPLGMADLRMVRIHCNLHGLWRLELA